jgi:DNA invertase Pin-like site-specific DNA recombinase
MITSILVFNVVAKITIFVFMKVLIYGRVSTGSQDVERQIEELKSYANYKKYEVVEVYTETISGVKERKDRKEISRLLRYIESNEEIKGVLVWELSRLGRNTLDILDIIDKLTKKKIWLFSKKEGIVTLNEDGTENPTSKLTLTVLSGVATHERDTILKRTTSGMINSVLGGNWLGGKFLPYGYKREEKKLVIDLEESLIIQEIFQLYLSGKVTQRIANELNKRKVPTRYNKVVQGSIVINSIEKKGQDFDWKDGTIYSILTNRTYIGKKTGKGKIDGLKLNTPVIIDEEIFNEVQLRLKSVQKTKTTKFFYLFDHKLFCGVCGRTYFPHKRLSNKDNRYICLSKRYKESCINYGIGISKMNDGVWSILRHSREELEAILESNTDKEELQNELTTLTEQLNENQESIDLLDRKEKKLVELYLEDKMTKDLYSSKYDVLRKEKEVLSLIISGLNESISIKKKYIEKQSNLNNQLRGIKDDKRLLKRSINNVVNRILIYPVVSHNIPFKFNLQDRLVFVEVETYVSKKPLCFIISQRTNEIFLPQLDDYDKFNYIIKLGKEEEEEEEEGGDLIKRRKLFHLTSLD